jgi:prevent-host-death family protein
MDTYNIHDAKAQFSKIMRQVEQGQEVLIARDGVVMARLVPESHKGGIRLGRDEGLGRIHADFEAPLDDFAAYSGK